MNKQKYARIMQDFSVASFTEKCSKLAFLLLCIFFLDISAFGGGRYLMIGPLSPRMITALLAFLLCIPSMLQDFPALIKRPVILMFGIFGVYLLICGLRGYYGDGRMNVLLTDLKGFAWLFIVPVVLTLVKNTSRFHKLLSMVVAGSVIQAVIIFTVNFLSVYILPDSKPLESFFINAQFGVINRIHPKFYRIFTSSSPYLVIGCAIALFRQIQARKILLRYTAIISLLMCAILLSFTRSLYGCVAVVFILAMVFIFTLLKRSFRSNLRIVIVTAVAVACTVFLTQFVFQANYLGFAVSRTFGLPYSASAVTDNPIQLSVNMSKASDPMQEYIDMTQESDALRIQTQKELLALFQKNPIFGNGLGVCAPVRITEDQPATSGLDEYFYLDMLARMGILGLVLYLLPFFYVLLQFWKQRRVISANLNTLALLCGMFGFLAATWFNPWMNSVLGISTYALCCAIPTILAHSKETL